MCFDTRETRRNCRRAFRRDYGFSGLFSVCFKSGFRACFPPSAGSPYLSFLAHRIEAKAPVDEYLASCAEMGREPNQLCKGIFNVRTGAFFLENPTDNAADKRRVFEA